MMASAASMQLRLHDRHLLYQRHIPLLHACARLACSTEGCVAAWGHRLSMALAAYRSLLRCTSIAFRGDQRMLLAARQNARAGFEQERSLLPNSPEATEKIQYAHEVAKVLKEEVLQGKQVDGHKDRYRLRIHEHIKLGDNEDQRPENKKPKPSTTDTPTKPNPLSQVKVSTL